MKISTLGSGSLSRHVAWKASDFTLQEFANAEPSPKNTARPKKSVVNIFQAQTMEGNKENEELAWYEKDLSDYEFSDSEDQKVEETPTRKSKKRKPVVGDGGSGVVYSIDIWFLIGEHVHPEDIQRFAAICRGTHLVSHSARFWINIYERLIKNEPLANTLPYDLSPSRLKNLHGLRARVIRTLFLLYQPFKNRLKILQPFGKDPDILLGYRCTLTWYKEDKNLWYFYFKFQNPHRKSCNLIGVDVVSRKRDLLDDDNIHYNNEDGNYVLQVVSQNFMPLPVVMGEILNKASLSVGLTMSYHKIKLEFDHSFHKQSLCSSQIVIDPVLNMQVFPWWHPAYPCNPSS